MNKNEIGSLLRRRIIFFIIIGFFSLLSFQLFQMQILQYSRFDEKSNENSIKKVIKKAPRGIFFDRNYNAVVSNTASFTLQITPASYDKSLSPLIEKVISADSGYIDKLLFKKRMFSKYHPVKIKRNIGFDIVAWVDENSEHLPGVNYVVEMQRDYSFNIIGSHMFGYTREISAGELKKNKNIYSLGDVVGFTGIEKTYERFLRGEKGYNYLVVDSRQKTIGKYVEGKKNVTPVKGYDLVIGIDADAQREAEKLMRGKKGAIVAVEPRTGEILAFVSSPQYSLKDFSSVTSGEIWDSLSKSPDKPLFNRATMSIKPPGSTIKMLEAIIGLEEGIISPYTKIKCKGSYKFGNRTFKCTHVHGIVNVEESIEKSCNVFYYQLILKIGLDKWSEYLKQFGFGKKTGIDISEESDGIVPDSKYYDRVYGKRKWTEGYVVSLGIGQGELSVTPIQLAQYAALLANNGRTRKPHFVKGVIKSETQEFIPINTEEVSVNIKQKWLDLVKKGMYDVVNRDGTAVNIKQKKIVIAGKTGTAQNPHGEDHALFIAFAPYKNPQIAIAVIVENIGYGSTYAAPIARDVIDVYLKRKSKSSGPKFITQIRTDEKSIKN